GHLFAVDVQHGDMHPIVGKFGSVRAFGLCDFVFMVGELKVRSTSMDIEGLAKVGGAHRRAFDMPSGSPVAPGAWPRWLIGFGGFPEREVAGMLFTVVDGDAFAGAHVIEVTLGQFAVVFEAGDVVIDIAVYCVGVPAVD